MNTASRTVRDVVVENPAATRIFEQLGIDYCCGGEKPLEEACAVAKLNLDEVLAKLEAQQYQPGQDGARNWQKESLSSLIEHITSTHHVFVRNESPRLTELIAKVSKVHGDSHPELHNVQALFADLAQELSTHLMKEEQILFPYLVAIEQSAPGESAPASCFGTVRNPIRMMMFEHDNAGNALRELRRLTQDYLVPAGACVSFQTLYRALPEFEADLHQHIHLENNILFPRAIALESGE
jgi:regulator of cell morphogenesis and NO signaling